VSIDPNSDTRGESDEARKDEAAKWIVRRDRGLEADEAAALIKWSSSESNHEELRSMADTWSRLDKLQDSPEARAKAAQIMACAKQRHRRRRWVTAGGVAMAIAASVVVMLSVPITRRDATPAIPHPLQAPKTTDFQLVTGNATPKKASLPDGSTVELNGDSKLEYKFDERTRQIRLLSGEAYFTVAKDPNKPFIVSSNGLAVRAVGTAFNVRIDADRLVEVFVTEGVVKLENASNVSTYDIPLLAAGSMAQVLTARESPANVIVYNPSQDEIDRLLAWRDVKLTFDQTPLVEVVETFNRHNSRQLVLGDPSLGSRTLTGSFLADNLDEFIVLLGYSLEVVAEAGPDNTVVLSPKF
jgi:transmembrane sensor